LRPRQFTSDMEATFDHMSEPEKGLLKARYAEVRPQSGDGAANDVPYIIDALSSEHTSRCWFIFYAYMDYTAAMTKSTTQSRRSEITEGSFYKSMFNWIADLPPCPESDDQKMVQSVLETLHCASILNKLFPEKGMYMIHSVQNLRAAASELKNWSPPGYIKCYSAYNNSTPQSIGENLLISISMELSKHGHVEGVCIQKLCDFIQQHIPFYMVIETRPAIKRTILRAFSQQAWSILSAGMKLKYLPGGKERLSECFWYDFKATIPLYTLGVDNPQKLLR